MSGKPVVLRDMARNDIEQAADHYLAEAGSAVALRFIDAAEATLRRIGKLPGSGSPRYAHELDIPDLRFLPTGRFPYLIFYVEGEAEVDVWRILHGTRDIPAWMRNVVE